VCTVSRAGLWPIIFVYIYISEPVSRVELPEAYSRARLYVYGHLYVGVKPSHIQGRQQPQGVRKQGAEEDIWTYEETRNKEQETRRNCIIGTFMICTPRQISLR
jgi:hypothetical protein